MGGRCPRALDLKGPRETERKKKNRKKRKEERKRKQKKKENKRKKKKRQKKERTEKRKKREKKGTFQIPRRRLNTIYPHKSSSYRKLYLTEGPIPKCNLKLVISTKYLKYEMNNGEKLTRHRSQISQHLGPISLKKCNRAVLSSLKRICDLGPPIFPLHHQRAPNSPLPPIKSSHIQRNSNFPSRHQKAQFLFALRGPDFSIVSSRVPISPLRYERNPNFSIASSRTCTTIE